MKNMMIFSKREKKQEIILLDLVKSAISCNLCFLVEGYKYIEEEKIATFISVFKKTKKDDEFINWEIDPVIYQNELNFPITYIDNDKVLNSEDYHRIAISSISVDDKIAFHFCYEYLKINQEDIFIPDNIGLTWNTIKERYENGYKDNWFCQVYK